MDAEITALDLMDRALAQQIPQGHYQDVAVDTQFFYSLSQSLEKLPPSMRDMFAKFDAESITRERNIQNQK